eukprot:gene22271-biopygen7185
MCSLCSLCSLWKSCSHRRPGGHQSEETGIRRRVHGIVRDIPCSQLRARRLRRSVVAHRVACPASTKRHPVCRRPARGVGAGQGGVLREIGRHISKWFSRPGSRFVAWAGIGSLDFLHIL